MATIIKPCSCPNPFQDKKYGKSMRVHNSCGKSGNMYRCTVCKNEKG